MLIYQVTPKPFRNYFNNSRSRFQQKKKNSENFLKALNAKNPGVQDTIEYEKNKKQLNFLDLTVITNQARK